MVVCGNKKDLLATPILVIMNGLVSGLKFVPPLFCFPCFRTGTYKHHLGQKHINSLFQLKLINMLTSACYKRLELGSHRWEQSLSRSSYGKMSINWREMLPCSDSMQGFFLFYKCLCDTKVLQYTDLHQP